MTDNTRGARPLSTVHLVFGVLFVGIAAVKFIGEATNADLPRSAVGFPIVLIGAGIVGLIATVVNARRRSQATYTVTTDTDTDTTHTVEEPTEALEETTVIEEQS